MKKNLNMLFKTFTFAASVFMAFTVTFSITGCKSTPTETVQDVADKAREEIKTLVPEPTVDVTVKKIPTVVFEGRGLKYEVEDMYLDGLEIIEDEKASKGKAAVLSTQDSFAQLRVTFPAGIYECMLNEKAFAYNKSAVSVYIDNIQWDTNISNPPTSAWELTTKTPVTFTVPDSRTITVQLKAGKNKKSEGPSFGMQLDYIQFVKLDDN